MKNSKDIEFVDKIIGALRKSAIELEEFQVKATLGKAEVQDKYEEVKKKFNLFIHDSEFKIEGIKEKIEELNYIWKEKISNLHRYSTQEDLEFIRAWLRSQYADSIRSGSRGAENEDFTATDNVLVLVQLNGGNDGLNTLIPLDQMSELSTARPHVFMPENKLISLGSNDLAVHPALNNFKFISAWMAKIKENYKEIKVNCGR